MNGLAGVGMKGMCLRASFMDMDSIFAIIIKLCFKGNSSMERNTALEKSHIKMEHYMK